MSSSIFVFAQDENLYYNTNNKAPENGYFANQFEVFSGVGYPFKKSINLNIQTQISKRNALSIGGGYCFPGKQHVTIFNLSDFDVNSYEYTSKTPGSLYRVFFRHYRNEYQDGYNIAIGIIHNRLPNFIFNEIKFSYGYNYVISNRLSIKFDIGLKYCDYSGKIPFTSFDSIGFSPTVNLSLGYIFKIK